MPQREVSMLLATLLVTSLVTGIVAASSPPTDSEQNGLSANESATLWSRDADNYISEQEYQQRHGSSRTAMEQLANGTDITFKRPPATAGKWTRNDFRDLDAGGSDMSVHPPHASLEDGVFIEDAHATIFAVQPSTRGHLGAGQTPLYIAPEGSLRGFVDYRVQVPDGSNFGNTTIDWDLTSHEIETIRLKEDGETIAESDGTHTPTVQYQLEDEWSSTLILEAEITVQLRKTTTISRGNQTNTSISYRAETVIVSDSIETEVYDLSAYPYYAKYPNGDAGVAIFQTRPWQGYRLTEDGATKVRGVWRFYTARNTNWDTLIKSSQNQDTRVSSDAIPVYVHAYPSRIGPRTEPVRTGPDIIDTWGTNRSSPAGTIDETVDVGVVNQSYTTTDGIAIRTEKLDTEALRVAGLVRGVNATIAGSVTGSERQIRRSNLSVTLLQQNETRAILKVELRDNETGAPIALNNSTRQSVIGGDVRNGYITVGDRQIETNASGIAIVTLENPGIYTARYHPGTWLSHEPAYVSDTATVRWHPLGTLDGWFAFLVEAGWQLIPFFVVFYAGHRLLRMLGPEDIFENHP